VTSPVVEVDGLCKSFWVPGEPRHTIREHVLAGFRPVPSRRFDVLSSISFTVRRGEALGIMGANGCGKSTLLKMVCGVYQPDRGSVRLRGDLTPILDLGIGWNPGLRRQFSVCRKSNAPQAGGSNGGSGLDSRVPPQPAILRD